MLVKVIKSSDPYFWYKPKVGTIVPVRRVTFSKEEGVLYWANEGGSFNALNFIKACDCEVVEDSESFALAAAFDTATEFGKE